MKDLRHNTFDITRPRPCDGLFVHKYCG